MIIKLNSIPLHVTYWKQAPELSHKLILRILPFLLCAWTSNLQIHSDGSYTAFRPPLLIFVLAIYFSELIRILVVTVVTTCIRASYSLRVQPKRLF